MTLAVDVVGAAVDRGGRRVVRGVDLRVARATWCGVIGANGSGKTSLLRALAGRLPFAGGTCRFDGGEVGSDRSARAQRCGFAPPPDRLPDALRAGELLDLVAGDRAALLPRLEPLRAALGLDGLFDRWIGDCSAGMRQRIAIAAAFAQGQPLVILDEPFNWLDPVAAYDLRQALRGMVDGGLTLMTALHDLGTLALNCDSGLMLADGTVAMTLDDAALRTAAHDPQAFERRTIDLLRAS